MGFEPVTSAIPEQGSTNQANKPTGSWSLCWIMLVPKKNLEVVNK